MGRQLLWHLPVDLHTSSAEQKFAATELEVAGLVFALEHFEVYVLDNQVTVYTDHQALVKSYLPY